MLQHHLALALGKTLGEISEMPWQEFRRWLAYARLYPINQSWLDDMRTAMLRLTVAQFTPFMDSRQLRLNDFRMPWEKTAFVKAKTGQEIASAIQAFGSELAKWKKKPKPKPAKPKKK